MITSVIFIIFSCIFSAQVGVASYGRYDELIVKARSRAAEPQTEVSKFPHGLLPNNLTGSLRTAHENIIASKIDQDDTRQEACEERLRTLRDLVYHGELKKAIDLSFALAPHHRDGRHKSCQIDTPFVGDGTIRSYVATPQGRDSGEKHAAAVVNSSVLLHHIVDTARDGRTDANGVDTLGRDWLRVLSTASSIVGHGRLPLLGFTLDGVFVAAEAQLRCRPGTKEGEEFGLRCDGGSMREVWVANANVALDTFAPALVEAANNAAKSTQTGVVGRRRASMINMRPPHPLAEKQLNDPVTTYAVGAKSILAIITCPQDSPNCASQSFPLGYCYGKVASVHGCSDAGVAGFVSKVMANAKNYFASASWGTLRLSVTLTPILKLPYTGSQCGDNLNLAIWSGGASNAFDMMAYAAARARGFDIANFDFNLIFMPRCPATGFSSIGWVGVPGAILCVYGFDYDSSATHEIGHNLGVNHASVMTGGSRGAKAWKDSPNTWSEYGNPHSTMGGGYIETTKADFMIEGKAVFDWASSSVLREVVPFSSSGAGLCSNPSCGPFFLRATDTGSASPVGVVYGFQIATAVNNRFYFVEHRTATTRGSAALITWSDMAITAGSTGQTGNTVLADCTPETSDWIDAGCRPGAFLVLDVGTASRSQNVVVVVGAVTNGLLQVDVSTNIGFRGVSVPTPEPTSPVPTAPVPPSAMTPTPAPPQTLPPTLSARSCNDLGWTNAAERGNPSVCGESDNRLGGCSGLLTFKKAAAFCLSRGARLCSVLELKNDEARGTGCSLDTSFVWSNTSCGATGHKQALGSSAGGATRCGAENATSNVRCCADDFPDPSDSSCGELGWANAAQFGASNVCGESGNGLGGCKPASSWGEAEAACKVGGARLCTLAELQNDETRATGCSFDSKLVWSSTACAANAHALGMGSTLFGAASECRTDDSPRPVRCCADVFKPVSEKSCGELGWTNARLFGSSTVCGGSNDRLGGCSRWGSWEDANAFCAASGARLCTLTELKNDEARATGCSLDSKMLWSTNACGANSHIVGLGSSTFGTRSACMPNSTPRKVRCCADTNTALALGSSEKDGVSHDPSSSPTSEPSAASALSPPSPAPTHLPTILAHSKLPIPTKLPVSMPTSSKGPRAQSALASVSTLITVILLVFITCLAATMESAARHVTRQSALPLGHTPSAIDLT